MHLPSSAQRRARQVTLYGAMLAALLGVLVADLFQPALADAADAVRDILPARSAALDQQTTPRPVAMPLPPRACSPRRGFESAPQPLTD